MPNDVEVGFTSHSDDDVSTHTVSPLLSNASEINTNLTSTTSKNAMPKQVDISSSNSYIEHLMSIPELVSKFQTPLNMENLSKSKGLSNKQALTFLSKYGENVLTPPMRVPLWMLFLTQFSNMFMVLLLVAAFLSIIAWAIHPYPRDPMNLYLGVFLILVVIMTCYSTYRQEAKSDELMEQFQAMLPSSCTVIRDGITRNMRSEELVVGDLVWIKTGEKIAADFRVLLNTGLRVDQSMLTGECEPVESSEVAMDTAFLEARNIIFKGSLVVDGAALVLVIRTGDRTLLGSMVRLTGDMGKSESTLKADVNAFVWVISKVAVTMATVIFIIGVGRGLPVFQTLLDGFIVTIIANMPCGLPATVTACLFIVAERMGNQRVFVKKLDVIETLGSCSLICTDKTGTLTENKMSVSNIWCMGCSMKKDLFRKSCVSQSHLRTTGSLDGSDISVMSSVSLSQDGTVLRRPRIATLLEIGVLNSRVVLEAMGTSKNLTPSGDATELGLYRFLSPIIMECSGEDIETYRSQRPKVFEIPFSSSLKWQLSIHRMPGSSDYLSIPFVSLEYPSTLSPLYNPATREKFSRLEKDEIDQPHSMVLQNNRVANEIRSNVEFPEQNMDEINASIDNYEVIINNSISNVEAEACNQSNITTPHGDPDPIADVAVDAETLQVDSAVPLIGDVAPIADPQATPSTPSVTEPSLTGSNAVPVADTPATLLAASADSSSRNSHSSHNLMLLKGAPDVILPKCSHYLDEDGVFQEVTETFTDAVNAEYLKFATQGERVIGFAMRTMKSSLQEEDFVDDSFRTNLRDSLINKDSSVRAYGFCFVGLISLIDPPRPEVPDAVAACHTAGIKVVMVTGDHPVTALSIARKVGIITKPTREVIAGQRRVPKEQISEGEIRAAVIPGATIPFMTRADWKIVLDKDEIVFARTSPEHKLEIVRQFTAAGYVVAMTGDGVNDAPALRQAAIGVAMGVNGSDVAREAADIILLDDNFASIVVAIKEGRLLFDNLKKSVAYTVSHLLPEMSPVLLFFVMGCPLGMPAIMALCIDLLTELLPATSLAFEEPEADIMQRPPRDLARDKLVAWPLLRYAYLIAGLCETVACFMVYFEVFESYGISAEQLLSSDNRYFKDDSPDLIAALTGKRYSAKQQSFILHTVQSAFFLTVVCSQAVHIFQVRARTTSVFTHGLFGNRHTIIGVICAILLGLFVVYAPITQHSVFHSEAAPSIAIFRGTLMAGALIWGYNEGRKMFRREFPKHTLNDYLHW